MRPWTIRAFIVFGLLLIYVPATQVSAQGLNFRFVSNGEGGTVFWDNAGIFGIVIVGRSGTVQQPQTSLFYLVSSCCPFTVIESGTGTIANRDLRGDPAGRLILETDTSASNNPEFFRTGTGGLVRVIWDNTRLFVGHAQGTFQVRTASGLVLLQNGTTDSFFFPSVTGTVVGFPVGGSVFVSTSRSTNVTVSIQQGP